MSVSVALLPWVFALVKPLGGAIEAVLASVPVAAGSMVAVAVNTAVLPGASVTVTEMSPLPLAAPQLEPGDAMHVHVMPVSAGGAMSVTVASDTTSVPLLATT